MTITSKDIVKITEGTIEKNKRVKVSERYFEKKILKAAKKGHTAVLIGRKAFGYYRFDALNPYQLNFLIDNGFNIEYSSEMDSLLIWWDEEEKES